jgi:ceramide glucosyltransferase
MSLVYVPFIACGFVHSVTLCHALWKRTLRMSRRCDPFNGTVGVIMPVKGGSLGLSDTLARIATQEHVDYQLVVVTESQTDSAVPAIREAMAIHPRIQHVVAGCAERCSQKNYNLLAGLRVVVSAEVYVTVDADVVPPLDWLERLLAPFSNPNVDIVTTHHLPAISQHWPDVAVASIVRQFGALACLSPLMAIWGGGSAFRAERFDSKGLAAVWQGNVVDDVPAGPWALRNGLRRVFCSEALIPSRSADFDWSKLYRWALRQMQFIRHCDPLTWAAGIAVTLPIALLMSALPLGIVPAALGLLPRAVPIGGALIGLLALAMGPVLARVGGDRARDGWRLGLGTILAVFVLSAALIHSAAGRTIVWGGRRYRVSRGGRVESIEWLSGERAASSDSSEREEQVREG